ncbi:MAG: PQQ-dependent sugar dehydrogenase [Pyrinomonadaceae bacterium]|nr:PQQ-dependent sugar dehydrogenase [Pyrinomonadaceae bacterium]
MLGHCIYRFILSTIACLLVSGACFPIDGATLPNGFIETQVAGGLDSPTAMAFAPDGRLFVCLQGGQLRVIKNGVLLPTPFLMVSTDSSGERGLLGIAFDPDFYTNNYVYVYYTTGVSPKRNRISRFVANGDLAVMDSEVVVLELDNLSGATNHNGGAMHFGQDGKLYIAVGENANASNSQTLSNLLGKILRINRDGSVPSDNPFFNTASGVNRAIWAFGLRNPFTFAFQPVTGRMFINDVGQSTWEEINDGIAGSNYGWPTTEGPTTNPNFRGPIYAYGRSPSATGGCAITGGAFYNPLTTQFPSSYVGQYFFADFCSGWIRLLDPSNNTASGFATGIANPVDLQVAADGSLYYLARGVGAVYKVQYPANQLPPSISMHPLDQAVAEGQTATFNVSATGSTPLTYQWQSNGVNINSANTSSYTISTATLADHGARFRCVVSNAFGSVSSSEATLTVTVALPAPMLLTEENTERAIALDSVIMMRDPFPLVTILNLSFDQRTRVMLFAINVELMPGENSSVVTAQAEDSQHRVYQLPVEFVGKVPDFNWLTQVIVKLPDDLPHNEDVRVSLNLRGVTSNQALIKIK